MPLSLVSFSNPMVQHSPVFFSDYGKNVQLTPMAQGIHVPYSIYSYMQQNFFQYICTYYSQALTSLDLTQAYLNLAECVCWGKDYAGMPTFDILAEDNTEGAQKAEYYTFDPSQFELFPKINSVLRTTYCNLGLWNLQQQYPNIS